MNTIEMSRVGTALAEHSTRLAPIPAPKPRLLGLEPRLDMGLIVAAGSSIFCVDLKNRKKIHIASRPVPPDAEPGTSTISSMIFVNDQLYDAGAGYCGSYGWDCGSVYETLNDGIVAQRKGMVYALASHLNHLYDSGNYPKVFRTIDDHVAAEQKEGFNQNLMSHKARMYRVAANDNADVFTLVDMHSGKEIARLNWPVTDWTSFEGHLYFASEKQIYKIEKDHAKPVVTRSYSIFSIATDGTVLYDCGPAGTFSLPNKRLSFSDARALHYHEGKLYAGSRELYEIDAGVDAEPIVSFGQDQVRTMVSVPITFWEKLAKKGRTIQ